MEQITIDIQLDPIKDGIKVPETDLSRPDAHAVILGTNGKISSRLSGTNSNEFCKRISRNCIRHILFSSDISPFIIMLCIFFVHSICEVYRYNL